MVSSFSSARVAPPARVTPAASWIAAPPETARVPAFTLQAAADPSTPVSVHVPVPFLARVSKFTARAASKVALPLPERMKASVSAPPSIRPVTEPPLTRVTLSWPAPELTAPETMPARIRVSAPVSVVTDPLVVEPACRSMLLSNAPVVTMAMPVVPVRLPWLIRVRAPPWARTAALPVPVIWPVAALVTMPPPSRRRPEPFAPTIEPALVTVAVPAVKVTPFVAPWIEPEPWLLTEPVACRTTLDPMVLVRVPALVTAPPATSCTALPPEMVPALMTEALTPSRNTPLPVPVVVICPAARLLTLELAPNRRIVEAAPPPRIRPLLVTLPTPWV